ncbi:MAG: hypothetical protein NZ580_01625, partial [Bacteroidia bacterium]|nr:hypothetical protein [Bacteroidia bacterium]
LWGFFSEKLPVSRLQRDLTDSTILRNLGVALGYGLVGILALQEGIERITPNPHRIQEDMRQHPEVLAEAWQVLQRREGNIDAYELALRQVEEGTFIPPADFEEYRGKAPSYVQPPE